MIGDTLTVTFDGVANTLAKINQDNFSSRYYLRTSTFEMTYNIRNANESSRPPELPFERHQCEFIYTVFGADASLNKTYSASTVIRLKKGHDPDVAEKVALALCGTLTASMIDKIVGWQS